MDVIEYLEGQVRTLVTQEIVELAEQYAAGRIAGTGHFSIPREVFCYVDHLGDLAFGGQPPTIRAISYLREYFPPDYADVAGLLVAMWRHGTVHNLLPRSYKDSVGDPPKALHVRWLSANHDQSRERGAHLLFYPIKGQPGSAYLVMNTPQLAEDLLSSINSFLERLPGDPQLKADADARLRSLRAPQNLASIEGKRHMEMVSKELAKSLDTQGGLISEAGIILKPHPKEKSP
jgi:hypothetical protein